MTYADCHAHTNRSDGGNTSKEIIESGKFKGLDLIAITDHDTTAGFFEGIGVAKKWGICLLPGVELTTQEHHLVGLNFDPGNKRFSK